MVIMWATIYSCLQRIYFLLNWISRSGEDYREEEKEKISGTSMTSVGQWLDTSQPSEAPVKDKRTEKVVIARILPRVNKFLVWRGDYLERSNNAWIQDMIELPQRWCSSTKTRVLSLPKKEGACRYGFALRSIFRSYTLGFLWFFQVSSSKKKLKSYFFFPVRRSEHDSIGM